MRADFPGKFDLEEKLREGGGFFLMMVFYVYVGWWRSSRLKSKIRP